MKGSLAIRFWSKVDLSDPGGCWLWRGTTDGNGYGRVSLGGGRSRAARAHRIAYEAENGNIPSGLTIDHLCRNRRCVNPAHLEAVTNRENLMRGEGPSARHARQSHCVRGHELAGPNLHLLPNGSRRCRTCQREQYQRRRADPSFRLAERARHRRYYAGKRQEAADAA